MSEYTKIINKFTAEAIEKIKGQAEEVFFKNGDLSHQNWANATFYHCKFFQVNNDDSALQNISYFSNVLEQVSFKKAVLSGVNFHTAILEQCDFSNSDICGTNFFKSKLVNCDFSNAVFEGANLWGASFINCDFRGADLRQLSFVGVETLEGCLFDQHTKLPFTTNHAQNYGMIFKKKNHLSLVSNENYQPQATILQFTDYKSNQTKEENRQWIKDKAPVINLRDYVSSKAKSGGPDIA